MAVKIKLKRLGKIRTPQYRIIVADARSKRDGRAIEEIGLYHPKEDPSRIEVNSERAQYWLSVGAQPTEPVLAILKVTGDWQKFKGLPGAEGTLRVADARVDKRVVFAAAVEDGAKAADEKWEPPTKAAVEAAIDDVVADEALTDGAVAEESSVDDVVAEAVAEEVVAEVAVEEAVAQDAAQSSEG